MYDIAVYVVVVCQEAAAIACQASNTIENALAPDLVLLLWRYSYGCAYLLCSADVISQLANSSRCDS